MLKVAEGNRGTFKLMDRKLTDNALTKKKDKQTNNATQDTT